MLFHGHTETEPCDVDQLFILLPQLSAALIQRLTLFFSCIQDCVQTPPACGPWTK